MSKAADMALRELMARRRVDTFLAGYQPPRPKVVVCDSCEGTGRVGDPPHDNDCPDCWMRDVSQALIDNPGLAACDAVALAFPSEPR